MVEVFGVVFLGLAVGWFWICLGSRKDGWRGTWGRLAVQVSAVVFAFEVIRGRGDQALIATLLTPPLYFRVYAYDYDSQFGRFLVYILPYAFGAGFVVLVLLLCVKRLRRWWLAPPMVAALLAGIVAGERISRQAMCSAAEAIGIVEFRRNTLLWSLMNTPRDFQFEIHARAEKDGRRLGWSYREMDWYEIPAEAWAEVDAPVFDCETR